MSNPVCAYWFGSADADGVVRLGYDDGREVRTGETLTVDGDPVLCEHGLHASRSVLDALAYGHGSVLACVRLSGTITEGDDKLAATMRETMWMGDVSATLHRFACEVAERALRAQQAAGREPDPRSWNVIAVKRRWLAGKATDADLAQTDKAAWAATWDAEAAAWTVAWGAAAGAAGDQERAWQEAHLCELLRADGVPVWEEAR